RVQLYLAGGRAETGGLAGRRVLRGVLAVALLHGSVDPAGRRTQGVEVHAAGSDLPAQRRLDIAAEEVLAVSQAAGQVEDHVHVRPRVVPRRHYRWAILDAGQ